MVSLFIDSDTEHEGHEGYVCGIYLCMEETYAIFIFTHTNTIQF